MEPWVSILGSTDRKCGKSSGPSQPSERRYLQWNKQERCHSKSLLHVATRGGYWEDVDQSVRVFLCLTTLCTLGDERITREGSRAVRLTGPLQSILLIIAQSSVNGGQFPLRCLFDTLVWHALLSGGFTLCICHKNCFQKKQGAWQDKKRYKKGILWFIYVKFMEDDRRHYSPKISCHSQIVNPVGQELKEWLGTETLGLWGTCGKGREVRGSQEACTEGFGQPSFKMQRWYVIVLGAILWAFQFWIFLFSSMHTLRYINIEYTVNKRLSRDKGAGQLTSCGFPKNQNSVKVNCMYSTLTMWQLIHILVGQKWQIRLLSSGKLWTSKRLNCYIVTVIGLTLKKKWCVLSMRGVLCNSEETLYSQLECLQELCEGETSETEWLGSEWSETGE